MFTNKAHKHTNKATDRQTDREVEIDCFVAASSRRSSFECLSIFGARCSTCYMHFSNGIKSTVLEIVWCKWFCLLWFEAFACGDPFLFRNTERYAFGDWKRKTCYHFVWIWPFYLSTHKLRVNYWYSRSDWLHFVKSNRRKIIVYDVG